jgi:ubiquinone/menaquinone biosynthesis C-methylase UbiE
LRRRLVGERDLRVAWEAQADAAIAWFRAPEHDSYWRYHRDQFLELLPAPGRVTLDIGCGEGRLSRDLKARGHTVVAVDASPTLVRAAQEADPEIETLVADAAELPFPEAYADLAIAFMSLQDVEDAPGAIREAARVLEPGGRFCFAVVHPLSSAGQFEGDDAESPFVVRGTYLGRFRYADTAERDGLSMTFESEHRPIQWYFSALESAGFLVERLRETEVPESAVTRPHHRRWQRLPLFLHLRAVRP